MCAQSEKNIPNGCNYEITSKVLKSYVKKMNQPQVWDTESKITSINGIKELEKIANSFSGLLRCFSAPNLKVRK